MTYLYVIEEINSTGGMIIIIIVITIKYSFVLFSPTTACSFPVCLDLASSSIFRPQVDSFVVGQ